MKVVDAPQWLVDQMEEVKKLPPPTLEEVEVQLKAAAEFIKETETAKPLRKYAQTGLSDGGHLISLTVRFIELCRNTIVYIVMERRLV